MTRPMPWPQIAQSAQQLGAADAAQRARVRDAETRATVNARMNEIRKRALLDALNASAPAPAAATMPAMPGARF